MRSVGIRLRVAAVVALAAILCATIMATLGLRITRLKVEEIGEGAALDMAAVLADELGERGMTPDRLAADAALQERAHAFLESRLELLNPAGLLWTNVAILQPVGDRWVVLARADSSGSLRVIRGAGESLPIIGGANYRLPSLTTPVAGRFRTDLNEWFGASAPIGTPGPDGRAPGVVSLTMHVEDVFAYMVEVLHAALLALSACIIVGLALGWWSAGVILRPVEVVRQFAAALRRREYAARVEVRGAPEMRRLLGDMNQLAEDLSQNELRLHERTVRMAEMRDPKETGPHVKRVSDVSMEIFEGWLARHPMEAAEAALARQRLRSAAVLHDVGKVAIEDAVLKKPGKLDEAEYVNMKHHSVIAAGAVLTGDDAQDRAARDVALHHHERWDGTGYPGRADVASAHGDLELLRELPIPAAGLAGTEIPLFARIVSIADVYDALRSPRSYKEPWPESRVLETIRGDAGKAFDPELVEIFLERQDRIRLAWDRHPDTAPHA
jgi:HD-GYP domain-containing protein (c-di-GMP phosphodiesterase class II)